MFEVLTGLGFRRFNWFMVGVVSIVRDMLPNSLKKSRRSVYGLGFRYSCFVVLHELGFGFRVAA